MADADAPSSAVPHQQPAASSSSTEPQPHQAASSSNRASSLPIGLARRYNSTTYHLREWEPPAAEHDEDDDAGEPHTAAHDSGSEVDSDGFGADWASASGSPDLRQGLLEPPHSRHSRHRQRQAAYHYNNSSSSGTGTARHASSRLSGHQQQPRQQQQHAQQSAGSGSGGGLLAALFGRLHSQTAAATEAAAASPAQSGDMDSDPTYAAAVTADMLESGGSLTFAGHAAAVSGSALGAAAGAGHTHSTSSFAQQAGSRTFSAPLPPIIAHAAAAGRQESTEAAGAGDAAAGTPAAATESAATAGGAGGPAGARSGELNEHIFSGLLGPRGSSGASGSGWPGLEQETGLDPANNQLSGPRGSRRGSHSVTLGQTLSKGKRRWQGAAQKVIAMKHITSSYRPGALQGLDVKRHCYDGWFAALHTDVNITCVDYNKDKVEVSSDITNTMLPEFLKVARPEWSKVRWINVQGLSWDVITTLAVAFDLHPLSVEDIVHIPQRIKADYYPEYLYVSVILLSVDHPSHLAEQQQQQQQSSASSSKQHQKAPAGPRVSDSGSVIGAGGGRSPPSKQQMLRTRLFGAAGDKHRQALLQAGAVAAAAAAAGGGAAGGVNGSNGCQAELQQMQPMVEQASMFLFRDGTLITMFSTAENDAIARRLISKLEGFRSLLTDSQDASYLFNAVLDAVVDHTLPLVQVYSSRIATLESRVLLEARPPASLTKELHLLSNDLKLLRRTLVPTQHLVHKLQSTHDKDNSQGFLSPLTVLYLSDVFDHISTVVEDMVGLAEDAKDLIDLIFNTISHNNNSSMQMLAVVSCVFLPITWLAGVYGMNFDGFFPEIHWHWGYLYFWGVSAVVSVGFLAMLRRMGMLETGSGGAV